MSDDAFQTLLRELFQGDDDRLGERLRPLTAEQRKALFDEFSELLDILHRACRHEAEARASKLNDLFEAVRDDPAGFLRDKAATLAAPGALNNPQIHKGFFNPGSYGSLMGFYSRLNLLRAGLAGKSKVVGAFKTSSRHPARTQKFVLYAGRVLLDRPEPWVGEALALVFEQVLRRTRFDGGDQGVARLMLEARQRHPEWAETLAPHLGMAMRRDGFFSHALKDFDAAMILAGLEFEPTSQEGIFEPLLDNRVVESLLRRLADNSLPRAELLALILRKLQSPLRPSVAKCWIDLFDRLAPTAAELRDRAGSFIDLLNAPAPAASKLAFKVVEQHFLEDADRSLELLSAFEYGLRHPVQALAKAALRLLKKQLKRAPGLVPLAVNAAVDGLASPHATLRAELLRWLGTLKPDQFGEDARQRLQAVAAALPAAELGPIAPWLAGGSGTSEMPPVERDDGRSDLVAAVATMRERVAECPEDSLLHRRLDFLEGYLTTGHCGEWPVKTPDHADALRPPDFGLHETAEAVALDIARTQNRPFGQADCDRIFAGMARFARDACSGRVSAILAPLSGKLEAWQQGSLDGGGWWGQGGELAALCMARAWRREAPPRFPKNSRGAQLLDSQFRPAQQRRLLHVAALIAAGHQTLLSTPTHAAGWLDPMVFAERFDALPPALLYADELGAALYRLPELAERRAEAWERLAPRIDRHDPLIADILKLALAPQKETLDALERLLRRFDRRPPTEPLFHALVSDFGGGGWVETFKAKIFRHDPDSVENAAFRLFGAALRCRFGLDDAGVAGRAPRLLERLSSARGWFSRMFHESQLNAALLTELLFAPRPLTDALLGQFSTSFPSPLNQDTGHPVLWPYLLANTRYFAAPELIADQTFRFPPLAQRFFEAGLCRLGRKDDFYRELTLALLMQGNRPQVDIRPHLAALAQILVVAQPARRESGVDLLAHGLRDGRITPADLAGALAARIKVTEAGFAPLDQALASLCATGAAGQAAVWLALERVAADGLDGFSPRKQSLLLDRLAGVLEETGRALHDPSARQALEVLAAAKKKSVARDKARALVARSEPSDQPPPQVWAVVASG